MKEIVIKFNEEEWQAVVRDMQIRGMTEIIELDSGKTVVMKIEG